MFNKEIEFISKKKIIIFKINNFLDNEIIKKIDESFPVITNITLDSNFGKAAFNTSKTKVIENNKELQDFHEIVSSNEFFTFFTSKFFFKIAFNQAPLRLFKYLRIPKKDNKKESFFDIFFSKLRLDCEFSSIKNNGGIVPHVDGLRKYLSLMLYFPNKEYEDHEYGTTFWESDIKNHSNTHITNKEQILNFKKTNKILYKTPFISNTLYGFIRNNRSWHSVEPLNINDNYIRRSININLFYEN